MGGTRVPGELHFELHLVRFDGPVTNRTRGIDPRTSPQPIRSLPGKFTFLNAGDYFLPDFGLVHLASSPAGIDEQTRAQLKESNKPDTGAP
jgi:hypothetical protein